MRNFEYYQKQFCRAAEDAFINKRIEEIKLSEHFATLFRVKETKFKRTVALLRILKATTPFELKYDYKKEDLPFNPVDYEFQERKIDSGGENDVYLLESKKADFPSWVLKINHCDEGNTKELAARASQIKKEYEEVRNWYANMPELIPQEDSLIMESPRNGKPAIITLQQYYGHEIKDIFELISQEKLSEIFEENPKLKEDLLNFLRITKKKEAETGSMVDLGGPKNLSLIKIGDEERLILLDPHLISHPNRTKEAVKKYQRERLEYLCNQIGHEESENFSKAA